MKIKDHWIEYAIQTIKDVEIANDKGIYPSEYKRYFSAFGASVIQSGLLAAVVFYEESEGSEDKNKLLKGIATMLNKLGNYHFDAKTKHFFSQLVRNHYQNREKMEKLLNDVHHAAVALKLALRTYQSDNNKEVSL